MGEELRSILVGTVGLSIAACAALVLTWARGPATGHRAALEATGHAGRITVLLQSVHFSEELWTGFHIQFPELFGLTAWSPIFFVGFNLFWLAVWWVSCQGLIEGRRYATAALWFLAIAGVTNGVAHPLFSVRAGGYFPGLLSSPVIGLAGLFLLRCLGSVTSARRL